MRKRNLTCPECGKSFSFHFMKNHFSSRVNCPSCKEQLYVENRIVPYILIAAVIFVFSDYILAIVKEMNLSSFVTYSLVFISLLAICMLLIVVLKVLFGESFLYTVRSHHELYADKERIEKMKKEVKNKKSQEKR